MITGANGAVGKSLIRSFDRNGLVVPTRLRALVRDFDRARALRPLSAEILEIDYRDPRSVEKAMEGAEAVVHLAGALIPRKGETLHQANVMTTEVVARAALAGNVKNFVYLSFPGADPHSKNRYLRTKGLAEKIITEGGFDGAIFRVSLIIGPGSPALRKMSQLATARFLPLAGGGTVRLQPIFQEDILTAIHKALLSPARPCRVLELVGPETVSYAELLRRVGERLGRNPRIFPFPKPLGWLAACLAGVALPSSGLNRTVFDIVFHEHLRDPAQARSALSLPLTPLNEMLDQSLSEAG